MKNNTKLVILNAFNSLLKKYEIEKITVDMVLKEADIGKTTFYRYYKDKYDVMSYNYDYILGESIKNASDLKELFYNIIRLFHALDPTIRHNLYRYKGANSTNDYMIDSSMAFIEKMVRKNRPDEPLTPKERFQSMIIIGGISVEGPFFPVEDGDDETFLRCAEMLYELFPDSLKFREI